MDCPACKTESLLMMERPGIEIDYCPKCCAVWLDCYCKSVRKELFD